MTRILMQILAPLAHGGVEPLAYLIAFVLGAALAAALQAAAVIYLSSLLAACVLVAAMPVLIGVVASPGGQGSHWLRRPAGLGVILGLGTAGALALALRLIGSSDDTHLVRPFIPALVALPADALLVLILGVRGFRSAREAARGSDLKEGATSVGLLAARALSRAVAILVFGVGALVLSAALGLAAFSSDPETPRGGLLILGAIVAFFIGGLGSLFAWWGRRTPARASPKLLAGAP